MLALPALMLVSCGTGASHRSQEEREVREEIREDSSLQDPGGAKGVREETGEQQQEEQKAIDELDRQQ
jgi:hypothetical protein